MASGLTEEQAGAIAKALAEPRRVQILQQIGAGESAGCQCLLAAQGISAGTLSHHLKELEQAGLIVSAKEGKFARLTLRREVLRAYSEWVAEI